MPVRSFQRVSSHFEPSMEEEKVKVDAIVVGGGPAGLTAAYVLAQAGVDVVILERGEYAGAKNVSGLLYSSVINEIMPEFFKDAPLERPVCIRSIAFLDMDGHCSLSFGTRDWSTPPYNNTFVVYRAKFDRWLAAKVESAGGTVVDGTVAEELIWEREGPAARVVGVRVRGGDEFYSDVVLLADGANGLVTESAFAAGGLSPGKVPQSYALGVKEVISLPRERIEDRFHLERDEGAAMDFIGSPFGGLIGGGFLYTGKDTLALGFIARLDSLVRVRAEPNEVMEAFKRNSYVRRYIQGGELVEYAAHLVPEGGYHAVPELTGNGLIIAGDAAGLVNVSIYHEGSNLAMASGRMAADTVIRARGRKDFSKASLASYEEGLEKSFVMADLKQYRDVPELSERMPQLLSLYPRRVCRLLVDYYRQSQEPKRAIQREALKRFFAGMPKARMAVDLIRARRLV